MKYLLILLLGLLLVVSTSPFILLGFLIGLIFAQIKQGYILAAKLAMYIKRSLK